jgi:hypothetical protein
MFHSDGERLFYEIYGLPPARYVDIDAWRTGLYCVEEHMRAERRNREKPKLRQYGTLIIASQHGTKMFELHDLLYSDESMRLSNGVVVAAGKMKVDDDNVIWVNLMRPNADTKDNTRQLREEIKSLAEADQIDTVKLTEKIQALSISTQKAKVSAFPSVCIQCTRGDGVQVLHLEILGSHPETYTIEFK